MPYFFAFIIVMLLSACASKPAPTPTRMFDFKIYDLTDARENKSALPPFIPERAAMHIMAGMSPPVLYGRQTAYLTPILKEQTLELKKADAGQPEYKLTYIFHIRVTTPDGQKIVEEDMGCVAQGTQPFKLVELVQHAVEHHELVKGTREDRILTELSETCLGEIGEQIEQATTRNALTY